MTLTKTLTGFLVFISTVVFGQKTEIGSVSLDLKKLSDLEFSKKYSAYTTAEEDLKVTKFIWSSKHLRAVDKELKEKGVPTLTMIDVRPSNESKCYIIGHYQLPTPDHLFRMSFYRFDLKNKTIDFQNLNDLLEDKWKRVE